MLLLTLKFVLLFNILFISFTIVYCFNWYIVQSFPVTLKRLYKVHLVKKVVLPNVNVLGYNYFNNLVVQVCCLKNVTQKLVLTFFEQFQAPVATKFAKSAIKKKKIVTCTIVH